MQISKLQPVLLAQFKMASKNVLTRYKPLLNPTNHLTLTFSLIRTMKNSSLSPAYSLLPKTNQPFTIQKSGEMTQATTLSPTDVHPRGPCPPPVLKCPPPPCACPPPPEVITLGRRIIEILWFLTKLGVFLAVVKFTIDEGLWGTGEETEALVEKIKKALLPEAKEEENKEVKEDEKSDMVSYSPKELWNKLVLKVGELIGLKP